MWPWENPFATLDLNVLPVNEWAGLEGVMTTSISDTL